MRERDRDRDRETQRDTERQRHRETETQRQRETETDRQTERPTDTQFPGTGMLDNSPTACPFKARTPTVMHGHRVMKLASAFSGGVRLQRHVARHSVADLIESVYVTWSIPAQGTRVGQCYGGGRQIAVRARPLSLSGFTGCSPFR